MTRSADRPLPHAGDPRSHGSAALPPAAPDAVALEALRSRAAVLPESDWAAMTIFGPDAADYLHRRLTRSILDLAPGAGAHALQLAGDGRLQAELLVYRRGEAEFTALAPRRFADAAAAHLEKYVLMDRVELAKTWTARTTTSLIGPAAPEALSRLAGPASAPLCPAASPAGFVHAAIAGAPVDLYRDPRWTVPCFHAAVPKEAWPAFARALALAIEGGAAVVTSPAAFDYFRIEQGVPLFGADTTETTIPLEANLHDALDLAKGCFPGQEVLARINNLGHPAHVLARLSYEADGRPAPGARVFTRDESGEDAGVVTSAASIEDVSPGLAMASLFWKYRQEPGLLIEAGDSRVPATVSLLADYPDRTGTTRPKGF